jgi:hypothetical protein
LVEIEYLPYQKIIVHEVRRLELADLLTMVAAQVEAQKQGGVPGINWVDGIAFVFSEFMPSPQTIEENMKGRIHYQMVWYSETSYQNEKRATVNNRDYVIRLMKADDNPNFVELAKFLKNFKQ